MVTAIRVVAVTWAVMLTVLSGPAEALILPPDPFDATDRYASLLPAADGTITQVQAKISVPAFEPPGSGELIAKVRYKLPASASGSPGKPFYFAVSRAIPLSELSPTGLQLVTFDFSDYPIPALSYHRSLTILYLDPNAVEPQILAEYPSEQLLLRPPGSVIETELSSSQTAEAGSVVMAPLTVLRETGVPQTETIRFTVADTNGTFFLQLTNGDAQGQARVTAAVVTLNGQTIFRPEETLGADLPSIVATLPAIHLVDVGSNMAEHGIARVQQGVTRLYLIEFGRDRQGLWKIQAF